MCSEQDPLANGDIWFLTERDRSKECCHGNNIVGVILKKEKTGVKIYAQTTETKNFRH